ncbi:neutral/alkaline non-lysosomal ceramidase N-terminal domain-containing protein [candidate division KSB1 bacterium]|nr:neutral/alkaline non-lysosomal ceramidase N-terminal domain-containing protein [candidate division KSB1 bacterium]
MRYCTFIILISLVFSTGISAGDFLSGGFSRFNITPEKPVTLSGYESRKVLSTGIHDSLYARCCVFQSGAEKVILISTDVIGFYGETASHFVDILSKQFNLQPSQLLLCAIHTHSAPRVTLNEGNGHPNNLEYTAKLEKKLVKLVESAMSDMAPVTLKTGNGSSPVGVNRREVYYDELGNPRMWIGRNPDGSKDREVQVICVSGKDEKLKAVIWDYAVHSTCLGFDNYIISGDVHGLAEQFIERYLGPPVLAPGFAGASGDIDPWYRVLPEIETKNGWIPEPVLLGTLLGEEVVHVIRKMKNSINTLPLLTRKETIICPGKPQGEPKTTPETPETSINVSVVRMGDIVLVGFGGELLCEIGMWIKQASPFKQTIIITHCNGSVGYLPPRHLYHESGYEVLTSPFASGAAEIVIKRTLEILNQLYIAE